MTAIETKKLLERIIMAYPNFELTTERIQFWREFLEDVPFEAAYKQLNLYIKANRFPPTIADIRGDEERMGDYSPIEVYE